MRIRIEDILKERNLSIRKLSETAGIDYSTIYNIVKGNTSLIKFENIEKICKALDCTPSDIMEIEK